MGVCAVFIQGPSRQVVSSFDCDIPDDWNSHVGVCLQTKRQDGNTNEENGDDSNHLGSEGRIGFVEHEPDLWLSSLPPADCSIEVIILVTKPLGDLLIAGLLRVQIESVENCESFLGVSVLGVGHPAAWLHLLLEVYIEERKQK